jgi:lysophospholipase L1-like esterase
MAPSRERAAVSTSPAAGGTSVVAVAILIVVLIVALVGIDLLVLGRNNPTSMLAPHSYMALGDSLSFGYQPNLDFNSGFADDIFHDEQKANVTALINYACAGESTQTIIDGGCPGRFLHHGSYTGPQLQAAVDFLKTARNRGHVSPITLEIGSNDVINDWNEKTCSANSSAGADLARMDTNLTKVILPELLGALGSGTKAGNGDLHMLNYYNPYAKECPDSAPFIHTLNDHLQADAAQLRVPVVDVYTAFGGDASMASNICQYTWICDARFHDVHPTNMGYQVIAKAVELTLGLPGNAPLPAVPGLLPASGWTIPAPVAVASFRRQFNAAWAG